jgi:8-oxo-dGTP pyrophosphatase MutT (NUDIX family)
MLRSTPNRFGGCEVDHDSLPRDASVFRSELELAISRWREEGVKVAWLRLPPELSSLIPPAVKLGFLFHNADASSALMYLRVSPDAYVPAFATHYIGAGGVVLWEDKLLVVAERYRSRPGRHYKLPGGALHPGEHIKDAVLREVREETGVQTRFLRLVCFRHWHGYRQDKSDIYFVCLLEPLTFDIIRQEEEIEECLWMPVNDYLAHESVHQFNRRVVQAVLTGGGVIPDVIDGYGTPETHEFFMPPGIS